MLTFYRRNCKKIAQQEEAAREGAIPPRSKERGFSRKQDEFDVWEWILAVMPDGLNHAPEPKPSGQCEKCEFFLKRATPRKDDYCMHKGWVVGSQWWSSKNCGRG